MYSLADFVRQAIHEQPAQGETRIKLNGSIIVLARTSPNGVRSHGNGRGDITAFSEASQRRMRWYLESCLADYKVFITLTYPEGLVTDGRTAKEHLRKFMQECRRYAQRHGYGMFSWSMFWAMEFQKNGSFHFHILSNAGYPKQWVADTWYRIVGSQDPRHRAAGTRIEGIHSGLRGMQAYLSKYFAKMRSKVIPEAVKHAGRFWGVCGLRDTVSAAIVIPPRLERDPLIKCVLEGLVFKIEELGKVGLITQITSEHPGTLIYRVNTPDVRAVFSAYIMRLTLGVVTARVRARIPDDIGLLLDFEMADEDISLA